MQRNDHLFSSAPDARRNTTGAVQRQQRCTRRPSQLAPRIILRLALLLLLPALLWLGTPQGASALPHIWYVDKDASGANDGTSWADAYTTLQAALDVANANAGTTYEIWVAEGTYYPDEGGSHVNNSRTESFRITNDNVQLYGGFGGNGVNENLRTQRDWVAHPTILSGDIDQDGALTSNAYHVLYLDGVTGPTITTATVVDGFTISAGNATGSWPANVGGGGYCAGDGSGKQCSPALTNLIFSGNAATSGGGLYNNGASYGVSSPTLTNVLFDANTGAPSGGGGGMYNLGDNHGQSSPTLVNVIFRGNSAQFGGGMVNNGNLSGHSDPSLTNVLFSGNNATYGAGMYNWGKDSGVSSPTLTNVTFAGNAASSYGGGLVNDGGGAIGASNPTLANAILWGNSAPVGAQVYNIGNAAPAITYSDIDQDGYTGNQNIRQDPQFVTPIAAGNAPTTTGNYRLQGSSPAIDAGDNASVIAATDLDGWSRKVEMYTVDTGSGSAPLVDMGAYEAHVLYVDRDTVAGVYHGLSWPTAYQKVQDALDYANAQSTSAYEIWVAEGTYYPDEGGSRVENDREESFRINYDNVQLYGGFGGNGVNETLRTQRNWRARPTILSGDIRQEGIPANNSYHVLYLDGVTYQQVTSATVIDGFTVTAGNASNSTSPSDYGGGLYCAGNGSGKACSPTLTNLIFTGNAAITSGGAIYNNGGGEGTSSPSLTNVTFSGNQAYNGGGMYNNGYGGVSSPSLVNVIFSGNQAGFWGGGMYNNGEGGVSSPSLVNVTFSGNRASSRGGAIGNNGDMGACSPSLINVILWGNAAGDDSPQVYNIAASPVFSFSTVEGSCPDGSTCNNPMSYADPRFVAPVPASSAPTATGNYRLQAGSPAIDAGNNGAVPAGVTTDLDGNPRIANGVVDRGAYEYQPPPAPVIELVKQVTPTANVPYQGVVTYTLVLSNSGNLTDTAAFTDALPAQVAFGGWVANPGAEQAGNIITWSDKEIAPATALTYIFTATHRYGVGAAITNTATFSGSLQAGSADAAFTPACGASITVLNAADSGAGSLRQAIADVCTGGTIDFAAGLSGQTITLSSELEITRGMTIRSTAPITVSGDNAVRVFKVSGGPVTLDGLTIAHGSADNGNGAGIYNRGVLTLTNSTVYSNVATGNGGGGGIYNYKASPTLTNVTFRENRAYAGGAMYNDGDGGVSSPSLVDVTFSGNQAEFVGGAMYNFGYFDGADRGESSPSLVNVIFSGNQAAGSAGAMYNHGFGGESSPSLVNVTFSGNQAATAGGAMVNEGVDGGASSPSLVNVILRGNQAASGAQLYNYNAAPSIRYSLLPSTTADIGNTGGTITWGAGNITGAGSDPLFVAPIAASSAPTTTGDYRLQAGSPAIDAGDNLSVTVVTDLDGHPRIVNGIVDMGAYEKQPAPFLSLSKQVTPATDVAYQGVVTYTLVLSNSGSLTDTAALTDALPAQVAFGGWVANPGAEQAGNVITWSDPITPATALTYIFTATHTAPANSTVTNTAEFSGSLQSGQAAAAFTTVAAATTTALASAPNPSSYGQSVVFTATVAAAGGPPTGDVVFEIDDTPVHTGTLTSGVATYVTASLAVGDHPVYAEYVGDANFVASASAVITQTVLKATAAVTLTDLSQTYDGAPKAATAATAPAGLAVNLTYDGSTTQPIAAGSYTVVGAVDDLNHTGVATDTLVIATAGTTTTLTSAPNPALAGASVTFTASVTLANPLGRKLPPSGPTGNVTFRDGLTDLDTVALTGGVATFSTSTLAVGSHTITAVYAGDSNHAGNTSALLVQVIDRGVTAVNDAAGTLEGAPVTIAVLANDHDPAGLGLTVITVTQGVNGAVSIAADGQTVIYTPTAAFTGTDSFTYGVQDGKGATDDALVTLIVAAQAVTDAPVQVAPADPAVSSTVVFSGTTAGVTLTLPAGFYTGTVTEKDVFYLAFTPVVTPTHSGPPSGWQFGGVNFTLEAFLNNASLSPIAFTTPVTITIAYSPAQVAGLKESTLRLTYWNGSAWVSDGIICAPPDTVAHTVTCQITHLTDFGLLGEGNPTAATLADFSALVAADAVTVLWTTADESNLAGFHLYRGAAADDPGVRLNEALIPAQGAGGLDGFSYSYVDGVATPPGAIWFYWLETVDFAGGATRHGPILAAALAPRLYLPTVLANSAVDASDKAAPPAATPAAPPAWPAAAASAALAAPDQANAVRVLLPLINR